VVKPMKVVAALDAMTAPTKIPKEIKQLKEDPPPPQQVAGVVGMGMGAAGGAAGGVMGSLGIGNAPVPTVKVEKPKGPARISGGVIAGNILVKTQPNYPPIARAAHVSGAVVLHALISKSGTIENLTVISGPEMLRGSAVDAVRTWKYKPYILSGEPTEVDTTITVNFNIGG